MFTWSHTHADGLNIETGYDLTELVTLHVCVCVGVFLDVCIAKVFCLVENELGTYNILTDLTDLKPIFLILN